MNYLEKMNQKLFLLFGGRLSFKKLFFSDTRDKMFWVAIFFPFSGDCFFETGVKKCICGGVGGSKINFWGRNFLW